MRDLALKIQTHVLKHFHYVEDEVKYGIPETFDHELEALLRGEVFEGDCDCFARTSTGYAKTLGLKSKDLIEMVTPNHYIAGIIDREINDVWVIENTGWEFSQKAVDAGAGSFSEIMNMPTYEKFANGYIEPKVYLLSELQKGIQLQDVASRTFIIRGRFKKYYMESFRTVDEKDITSWWQKRDDLPFLVDFVEVRDINVAPAEYGSKTPYTFTKNWENSLYDNTGYTFGKRSLGELVGVHPTIAFACHRAIERCEVDFGVFDGVRTAKEQAKLVARGVSKTNNSYHLYGLAVDLVPYINGRYEWDDDYANQKVKEAMDSVIAEYGLTEIENGFDLWGWDIYHYQLTDFRSEYDIRKIQS
jgi:peptidoglycan L-alanyl-D-glutamate endopeptidase CwlK